MSMEDTTSIYREFLRQELAGPAHANSGQIQAAMEKFDKLTRHTSGDTAFMVLHESLAATDTNKALNVVRSVILETLEKANKDGKKIEINPRERLKQIIQRFNAALDKCSVTINGVDLDRAEIDREKIRIPTYGQQSKSVLYSATASLKGGKTAKMTLEISR